jgi:hypothetical protein
MSQDSSAGRVTRLQATHSIVLSHSYRPHADYLPTYARPPACPPALGLSDPENEGTEPHQERYANLKPRDVNCIVLGLENSCSTSGD